MRNGGEPVNRMPSAARIAGNAAHASRRLVQIVHASRVTSEPRGTGLACSRSSVSTPLPISRRTTERGAVAQPDQRHLVPALRKMLGAHLHVLAYRTEIRRQPIGDDHDPPLTR